MGNATSTVAPAARIGAIDIARGMAILSVIAYHTGFLPLQYQILPLITPWMILLFPMTAGMIRTDTSPAVIRIGSKIRSTFLPYLLFGCLSLAGWLFLRTAYPAPTPLSLPVRDTIWNYVLGRALIFNGPLWFLPPYLIMYVIASVYFKIFPKSSIIPTAAFSAFCLFAGMFMNPAGIKLPYSADLGIQFTGYYLAGRLIGQIEGKAGRTGRWAIGVVFFYILFAYLNGTTVLFDRQYHNPILLPLTAMGGTWIILHVSRLMESWKAPVVSILHYAGRYSLLLFSLHWPLMQWLTFFLFRAGLLRIVNGIPNHVTFSYYFPDAVTFTLIEVVLLIFYMGFIFPITLLVSSASKKITRS